MLSHSSASATEKNTWIDKKSVTFANSVVRCDFGEQILYIEKKERKKAEIFT